MEGPESNQKDGFLRAVQVSALKVPTLCFLRKPTVLSRLEWLMILSTKQEAFPM